MMNNMILSEINIYPVKSLGGISLTSAKIEKRGLKYDRRFMLVDINGNFLTQRKHTHMALLKLKLNDAGFTVYHSNNLVEQIHIPFELDKGKKLNVVIWDDECEDVSADENLNDWFSRVMGFPCKLIYMLESTNRIVEPDYGVKNKIVSFADAYPYLIIGQSSLDELNNRLQVHLPMNRFRANFVFKGGSAYEEDGWDEFFIGGVKFKRIKPCARCIITTTDQETGERSEEPLAVLSTYRKVGNKVMFGQNLISLSAGTVKVGDKITFQ